jgi:hypothetical protein
LLEDLLGIVALLEDLLGVVALLEDLLGVVALLEDLLGVEDPNSTAAFLELEVVFSPFPGQTITA